MQNPNAHGHEHRSASDWYQYFGLYDQKGKTALPLKQVTVNAKVNDYIAQVTYSQLFCNPTENRLEAEYFFPISNTACFHSFKAKFGNVTMEGVIKKKEEAKQEYEKLKEEGHLVAYAEIEDQNYSVLCVKIGNIPPSAEIEVTFAYIERLEISLNKFWRFTLYSSIARRTHHCVTTSNEASHKKDAEGDLSDYPMYAKQPNSSSQAGPVWQVNVQVDSKSPITFIKSTSHEAEITKSEVSKIFTAKVSLPKGKKYVPDKDFVLLYATESIHQPGYLLSPFEEGYCTLINFFPEIQFMSFDDAYMASLEGRDPLEQMIKSAKSEFVFIIDKSSSLDRQTFKLLMETVTYFLQSLPSDSYCNVLVLGDSAPNANSISVKTTKEASEEWLKKVTEAANTPEKSQIAEAIAFVGDTNLIPGYSRSIFLLTDGQIKTPVSEVTKVIRERLFKTRVFVLGIGESSITDFAKRTALEGYGSYEIIRHSDEIPEKITHLLKNSVAPYFTDFELKIENEGLFSYIVPLPKVIGCISPNELVEFFVVFNKKLETAKKTSFTLKFYNGFNQRFEEFKQIIDIESADLSEAVVKLGMLKFCESLIKKKEIYEAMGTGEIVASFKEDVNRSLVNTSLRHGILTSETSFVCLVKEGDDIIRQIPAERMILESRPTEEGAIILSKEAPILKKKSVLYRPDDFKKTHLRNIIKDIVPLIHKPPASPGKGESEEKKTEKLGSPVQKTAQDIRKGLFDKMNKSSVESSLSMISQEKISPTKKPTARVTSPRVSYPVFEMLPYLIKLQQIKGYWEPQMVIGTLLGSNLSSLMKKMPKELRSITEKDRIWLTILVLVWIRHHSLDEAAVETTFKKAVDWLGGKGDNYNYGECFKSAKTALGF